MPSQLFSDVLISDTNTMHAYYSIAHPGHHQMMQVQLEVGRMLGETDLRQPTSATQVQEEETEKLQKRSLQSNAI